MKASVRAIKPRMFVKLAVVVVMTFALPSCGRTENYRYKLTLAVNTPTGVKRGSSVVEVLFRSVSFPDRGVMQELRGEALYLDLGPGARPLIALLTSRLHPRYGKAMRWTPDAGPSDNLLAQLYGPPLPDFMANISRIADMRGPHKITPDDLPDLVTFADISDPNTVIEVDPNNLQATLGPDVSWNEITLESTDEPITTGILTKLPWLPAHYRGMLDGRRYHDKNTVANTLSAADFDQSGDLERTK